MTDKNKTEVAGCAVCNPEGHTLKMRDEAKAKLVEAWEKDVQVAGCGTHQWAVISKEGMSDGDAPFVTVIYSELASKEAAEVARCYALVGLTDASHNSPYGPSDVPFSHFNSLGRVLKKLRDANAESDDLIGLAYEIANSTDGGRNWSEDIPF